MLVGCEGRWRREEKGGLGYGKGNKRRETNSSVIPVAAPQAIEKTVKITRASRIMNFIPKISLNFA